MPDETVTPACKPVNTLHPRHQQVLRERAVPLEVAERMGWTSITNIRESKEWAKKYGLDWEFRGCQAPRVSGLKINYHQYDDGSRPYRIRVDETSYVVPGGMEGSHHGDTTVEVHRYLIPTDSRVGPYFTDEAWAIRRDVSEPIAIAEAPLKAEALSAAGIPAIGLGGVCAGAHDSQALADTREILAHPEIKRIDWHGRSALIYFDAGLATNPMVALGAARVWRVLSGLGARVLIVPLPFFRPHQADPDSGVIAFETDQGPDDILARVGLPGILIPAIAADPRQRMRDAVEGRSVADRIVICTDLCRDLYFRASLKELTKQERRLVAQASGRGVTAAALEEVVQLFDEALAAKQSRNEGPYSVREGKLVMGEQELANFTAKIVSQTMRDDGDARSRSYTIQGSLGEGGSLPEIDVTASEFPEMAWVHRDWGARAIVSAGRGMSSHVAVAIQTLSAPTDRTVYTHTGWRELDGRPVFLMPGGGIGADGVVAVDVELPGLRGYRRAELTTDPAEVRSAVLASLAFGWLAPQTTMPLAGAVYLSPLASAIGGIDFMVWMVGRSGSQKSTLLAQALRHFGDFDHNTLPSSWTDTANALETRAYSAKDLPLGTDNYTPAVSERQRSEQTTKAERLIQSVGDGQARARCNRDGSLQSRVRYPRGVIISTAEILPPQNESTLGRCVVIERPLPTTLASGTRFSSDLEPRRLSRAQELGDQYGPAMAAYIQWLARRGLDDLKPRHRALRTEMTGGHGRTPGSLAALRLGWEMFLEFAVSVGAVAVEEQARHLDTIHQGLLRLGRDQPQVVHQRAVDLFVSNLRSMISREMLGLASSKDEPLTPRQVGGRFVPLVGWEVGDEVWLDKDATYASVTRELGARWLASETELGRQLKDAVVDVDGQAVRVLAAQEAGHTTAKRGSHGRVWVFTRKLFLGSVGRQAEAEDNFAQVQH
jgi:hypothetical protein